MNPHRNPSRQKVSFPLCGTANGKSTPQHKKSYSYKNTHQLSKTKSPSEFHPSETERLTDGEEDKER